MEKPDVNLVKSVLNTSAGVTAAARACIEDHGARSAYAICLAHDIVSAAKYYIGTPDGKFISTADFDQATVDAKKAYITINTLLGNDTAEMVRFSEGKKQTPGLISQAGVQKIIDMAVLLYAFGLKTTETSFETVRACRRTEVSETDSEETIYAFQSTTKATVQEIVDLGYANKNGLAICTYHFNEGAVILDMAKLGKHYLKPEEREVLILTGNRYKAKCLGENDQYLGKDGQPALMYDIEVYGPNLAEVGLDVENELWAKVFDKDMIDGVRKFYEALNANIGGEYPEVPEGYFEWKEALKSIVCAQLAKIHV